jgi:hypothetical protein
MKKRIYINKHKIKKNEKSKTSSESVITVFFGKKRLHTNEVVIDGPCKVVYSPDKPMSCGASVWIETESHVYCEEEFKPTCEL